MLKFLLENKKLTFIILGCYWAAMFIGTSLPGRSLPSLGGADKIKHFGAFFGLSILFMISLKLQDKFVVLKKHAYTATIIILSLYAVLDELHQMLIPGRSADILDWIADFTGIVLGLLLTRFILLNKLKAMVNLN